MTSEGDLAKVAHAGEVVEDVPTYVIQLVSVRTYELHGARSRADPAEKYEPGREPNVNTGVRNSWLSDDRTRFRVLLGTEFTYQYSRAYIVTIRCSVEGAFTSTAAITARRFASFREREALVLLWPYVRSAVTDIARLMEIRMAPLPLLDVRRVVGPRRKRRSQDE